jgi:hypothetical protein
MNYSQSLFFALTYVAVVDAFTSLMPKNVMSSFSMTTQFVSTEEDKAVECFIVNFDLVEEEGEIPEVVCTSEPDEFAWFNGLESENFQNTEMIKEEAFQECVEGASPTGVREWECKVDNDWKLKP